MNKIYIATHKSFTPPKDMLYIPIQVGTAEHEHLDYLTDDTGDNISGKNHLYGELTALYWIWKNEKEADYIGLCHYRRYFLNNDHMLLSSRDCDDIFQNYDIILPYKAVCPGMNYYEMFSQSHNINDLNVIEQIIAKTKPEYLDDYRDAIHSDTYYMGNLFVTRSDLFFQYAGWLFEIFNEAEKIIDVSGYDKYHRRIYGFLSEQMLMAWVNHHHLRVLELEVAITSEKAETTATLDTVSDYVKENDIDGAISYYMSILKERPDIRFEASDIYGQLPTLELALGILKSEQSRNINGICIYKNDLRKLLDFVRESERLLNLFFSKNDLNSLSNLIQKNVSWVMMERLIEHRVSEKAQIVADINRLAMSLESLKDYKDCLLLLQYALAIDPGNNESIRNSQIICEKILSLSDQ